MVENHQAPQLQANRLLGALPQADLQRMLPQLEIVAMDIKKMLYEINQPINEVYFPLSGVASVLASTGDEELIEVATIGSEGMVGLPVFLGSKSAPTLSFWQVPGYAARMKTEAFQNELQNASSLHRLMNRYTEALMNLISQSAACNRHHDTIQRLARWMLMSEDRVGTNSFPLTQEFIAQMLGVRRATANEAAQALQEAGLIRYQRGMITIVDRPGLERASCACYKIITDDFNQLIPRNPTAEKNPARPWGLGGADQT